MKRLPSMQSLQAFEAAARHQSYSAAAEEIGLTHGAISHRIRHLERQLGLTLFRREGRAMLPTRAGVTLLAQVRESLAMLARAVPDDPRKQASRLVVGVHPSLAIRWLVPRLGSFLREHPELDVEVRSTADLGEFLGQGVDVAIRYGAGSWANAARERLAGEVLFPVCTPAYRDAHRIRRPADLSRCHLLRHAWQPWTPWLRAARLQIPEPDRGMLLSDSGMLLEAALADEGVALARRLFAQDDLERGRLVSLFDVQVPDTYAYYLLWHAGMPLAGPAASFRDWLQQSLPGASHSQARVSAPAAPGAPRPARAASRQPGPPAPAAAPGRSVRQAQPGRASRS